MTRQAEKKNILEILLEVSRETSSSLEIEKVSNVILKYAKSFLKTDYSALFIFDEYSGHLMLIGAQGFKSDQIENLKVLGSWEKINEVLINKSKALIVNDISKSIAFRNQKIPFSREKLPLGAFLAVPLKKNSRVIGALIVSHNRKRKSRFVEADKKLLYTLANHVSMALLNAKLYNDIKTLFLNTVTSLVTAVDARDKYTHGHSERVARYAEKIAKEMGCISSVVENLKLAALLHDVGKIGIRDHILSKDGPLNEDEFKTMQRHPVIGSRIVASVMDKGGGVIRGIEEHHERYDGSGYPKQLKKGKISLEGRIIAIADTFDTLTTDRPYQKAFTAKEAALEIAKSSATHFDPRIVEAFQKSFSKYSEFWLFK